MASDRSFDQATDIGPAAPVTSYLERLHSRHAKLAEGAVATYIPELAKADPAWRYTQVAMRNLDAGRHIAPCLITRLNVAHAETRMHGRQLRILEAHVAANGHDLTVIASHWTSKLRQPDGGNGEEGRAKYARTIYDVYQNAARSRPDVDLLVCGDFNDTPDSDPVTQGLHATGDRSTVR